MCRDIETEVKFTHILLTNTFLITCPQNHLQVYEIQTCYTLVVQIPLELHLIHMRKGLPLRVHMIIALSDCSKSLLQFFVWR
jgi:hypothetical protein